MEIRHFILVKCLRGGKGSNDKIIEKDGHGTVNYRLRIYFSDNAIGASLFNLLQDGVYT